MWMRCIARTALAVGVALGSSACEGEPRPSDARDVADGQLATVPALGEAPLPGDTARGDAALQDSLGAAPPPAPGKAGDTGAGVALGDLPDARGERNGTPPADAGSSSPAPLGARPGW